MVYQWRVPGIIPVDAQTAGEELERIYNRDGSITPEAVVEDSVDPSAPLHGCFEWDDKKAAHKYRITQAQGIIRCIVSVDTPASPETPVRAFVSTKQEYKPITVVLDDEVARAELLHSALCELENFKRKYATLQELAGVFGAIEEVKL